MKQAGAVCKPRPCGALVKSDYRALPPTDLRLLHGGSNATLWRLRPIPPLRQAACMAEKSSFAACTPASGWRPAATPKLGGTSIRCRTGWRGLALAFGARRGRRLQRQSGLVVCALDHGLLNGPALGCGCEARGPRYGVEGRDPTARQHLKQLRLGIDAAGQPRFYQCSLRH